MEPSTGTVTRKPRYKNILVCAFAVVGALSVVGLVITHHGT
jgi:hypothetical protein